MAEIERGQVLAVGRAGGVVAITDKLKERVRPARPSWRYWAACSTG
ncbi:hypothetical protein [Mesorhizobium sp.]|nr:hypothetical protein [Mesorhizobium sp.]